MQKEGRGLTVGGRANEEQTARIDAAARLARLQQAHFLVGAVLGEAARVLRSAAVQGADDDPARSAV